MIVAVDIPEMKDIVDDATFRELTIVSKEMEREPYWFAHEGLNARLLKALRRCQEGGIERLPSGDHVVKGSAGRLYVVKGSTCECPASQKGKSSWCWHRVTVALYTEWQRRLDRGIRTPVVPSTLPVPPVTADERLAQPPLEATWRDVTQEEMMADEAAQDGPGDVMTDDDAQYIPEPDHVTVAILDAAEADFPPLGQPATRPLPGPVLLPSLDAGTLERSMQAWSAQRQVVKRFLQQELVEGTDFYTLRIKGRETKPALSKAGSEKFMALFQLHASFAQDTATWTMLGQPQGTLCYVCTLHTRSGEIVGEGRGARTIQQDNGDINKAVKMAQKSSCVDAILRTGALSDVFTQDLEAELVPAPAPAPAPANPNSADLRKRIWAQVNAQAPQVRTQDAAKAWVQERTGLAMEPDHYAKILEHLEARA